ncbi:MAG: ABC transporter permease [Bacteroidota bacterium]
MHDRMTNTTTCHILMYFCSKRNRLLAFEFFIAKRILPNRSQGIKVSRPILRIAVISISLSIVVNLLTFAVVIGFKNEIRRKVTGFSAPLFIQNVNNADFYESDPIQRSQAIESVLHHHPEVQGFNPVAYKPGMLQAKNETQEVFGLVFKGIDQHYDRSFLREHLVQGRIPTFDQEEPSDEIVLSSKICEQLNLHLNDEVSSLFVKNAPISRNFKLVGIYATGFEDYDTKLALCDIRVLQKLNDWGISGQLELGDSLVSGGIPIILNLQGNSEKLLYDWGKGPGGFRGQLISPLTQDTTLQVTVYSVESRGLIKIDEHSIRVQKVNENNSGNGEFYKESLNLSGTRYVYHLPLSSHSERIFQVDSKSGKGTSFQYLSGYEIRLKDWYKVDKTLVSLKKKVELIPTENQELVKVISIFDLEQDLFKWLAFLDINVQIIVTLMLLIGIINMGSALLILIIVRSNFIGLMKSMGASNRSLRRIFLIQAGYLIGRGLLYGNIFALAIYFLQKYTGILKLNPEVYYLAEVPMELPWTIFLALNLGSFCVCLLALMVPSYIISRINPIKTIRFN